MENGFEIVADDSLSDLTERQPTKEEIIKFCIANGMEFLVDLMNLRERFLDFATQKNKKKKTFLGGNLFADHINYLIKHKKVLNEEQVRDIHYYMDDVLTHMGEEIPPRRLIPQRYLDGGGECYESDEDAEATKFVFDIV